MKKLSWKDALVSLLLTASLSVIVGCQDGSKPVSAVSDAPPGADANDENPVVASMGAINLGKKQAVSYLQSLDEPIVTKALNRDGGLEELVKGVALRTNVITRAAGQNWQDRAEVKAKLEEAQRNVLYSMYVDEKSEPPADYPDEAAVAEVYEANKQLRATAGKPGLKPLKEIAPIIKKRLREKQRQANAQTYLNGLVSSNPLSVDLNKLVAYLKLPQEQKQMQQESLKESVARMGNMALSMGLVVKSLGSLEAPQQRQVLSSKQQLQQYVNRLAIQYFVLNEAIAAKFNARPAVNNHLEQARFQVLYATYMKAWSAPEGDFPSAVLVQENYQKNLDKLVVPDRYHLARIVIANSGDSATDAVKAKNLASAARASGADFATLARQYSQEPESANNGGDIGWLNTEALLPELKQMITGSQPGAVIGPVQFQQGWQLLKVLEHQPGRQQTLEEARPALVAALRTRRMAEKEKEILEQLMASEPVTIDKNVLQQLRKQIGG